MMNSKQNLNIAELADRLISSDNVSTIDIGISSSSFLDTNLGPTPEERQRTGLSLWLEIRNRISDKRESKAKDLGVYDPTLFFSHGVDYDFTRINLQIADESKKEIAALNYLATYLSTH